MYVNGLILIVFLSIISCNQSINNNRINDVQNKNQLFDNTTTPDLTEEQRPLEKELKVENEECDGFEFEWYEYSFPENGETVYAAFDINGNRITPNGRHPWYRGAGVFAVSVNDRDSWGHSICVGYNNKGKKIFPESLELTLFYCTEVGFFVLERYNADKKIKCALYNRDGECLIPWSMEYRMIEYKTNNKAFICQDENFEVYTYSVDAEYYAYGMYDLSLPLDIEWFNKNKKRVNHFNDSPNKEFINDKTNIEPGLLYRGDYTITSEFGDSYLTTISIYENYLYDGMMQYDYKSTNSSGRRVYSGSGAFGAYNAFYVNTETFDIRLVTEVSSPWGSSTSASTVTKGTSRMPTSRKGNVSSGSNSDYQWQEHGRTENPVQPHQETKDCSLCHGSGKCSTCNGKHTYYNGLTGKYLECPNCKPNGACSSCGGSGKKTSTKYY